MVLLMWVLFRLEKEEREPSDSFGNGKGIAIYKDGSNHSGRWSKGGSKLFCFAVILVGMWIQAGCC